MILNFRPAMCDYRVQLGFRCYIMVRTAAANISPYEIINFIPPPPRSRRERDITDSFPLGSGFFFWWCFDEYDDGVWGVGGGCITCGVSVKRRARCG